MTPEQERVERDKKFAEQDNYRRWLKRHFDVPMLKRLMPSELSFGEDAWLAACAHKEAQRAGDDEVIRELAGALRLIEMRREGFPEDLERCPMLASEALTKHATRIAAARSAT